MSFLTAPVVKSSHILLGIYFSQKPSQNKLESLSMPNLDLSRNIGKVVIKKDKL